MCLMCPIPPLCADASKISSSEIFAHWDRNLAVDSCIVADSFWGHTGLVQTIANSGRPFIMLGRMTHHPNTAPTYLARPMVAARQYGGWDYRTTDHGSDTCFVYVQPPVNAGKPKAVPIYTNV